MHRTVGHFSIRVTSQPIERDASGTALFSWSWFSAHHKTTTDPTSLLENNWRRGRSFNYTVLVPTDAGVGAVAVHIREARKGCFVLPSSAVVAAHNRGSQCRFFHQRKSGSNTEYLSMASNRRWPGRAHNIVRGAHGHSAFAIRSRPFGHPTSPVTMWIHPDYENVLTD
jgi:hypothetical protein